MIPSDDTGDSDYGKAPQTSPKKRKPKTQGRATGAGTKRPRHNKEYASEDIDDDSDVDEEELSAEDTYEEEEAVVINAKTGRPMRSSTGGAKPAKYADPSDSDRDIQIEDSEDDARKKPKRKREARSHPPSLIVKLKVPFQALLSPDKRPRPQTSNKDMVKPVEHIATRRSSRISHDETVPLLGLTDSGRHAKITRASASRSPPLLERRLLGGKRPPKPSTSDIEEASQENSMVGPEILRSDVMDESLEEPVCLR